MANRTYFAKLCIHREPVIFAGERVPAWLHEGVSGPDRIAEIVRQLVGRGAIRESLFAFYLDRKNRVLAYDLAGYGTLGTVATTPADVFRGALLLGADGVVVAHNHPSGDSKPSVADVEMTKSLVAAGKLLLIQVLDHLIVTDKDYFSFMKGS